MTMYFPHNIFLGKKNIIIIFKNIIPVDYDHQGKKGRERRLVMTIYL